MHTGFVERFDHKKGHGFVMPDSGKKLLVFQAPELIKKVRINDRVQFDIIPGKIGEMAINVKLIES